MTTAKNYFLSFSGGIQIWWEKSTEGGLFQVTQNEIIFSQWGFTPSYTLSPLPNAPSRESPVNCIKEPVNLSAT